MKELYIMQGPSGSGKSTWARNKLFECQRSDKETTRGYFSADTFFIVQSEYRFDLSKLHQAHQSCLENFLHTIQADAEEPFRSACLIVDNTNCSLWEMSPYVQLGKLYGYNITVVSFGIEVSTEEFDIAPYVTLLAERNAHQVPIGTIRSQFSRLQLPPKSWGVNLIKVPIQLEEATQ